MFPAIILLREIAWKYQGVRVMLVFSLLILVNLDGDQV
jgi:hypothetical protein